MLIFPIIAKEVKKGDNFVMQNKFYVFLLLVIQLSNVSALVEVNDTKMRYRKALMDKNKNKIKMQRQKAEKRDSYYDPEFDYSTFTARITDRDKTTRVYKASSENKNIAFFYSGDRILLRPATGKKYCKASVRSVEEGFFVLFIDNVAECWSHDPFIRRGSMIVVKSDTLAERVRDASVFRHVLLNRKKDYYSQFNRVNHFLWSYDQKRVQLAEQYDLKIAQLEKEKADALEHLRSKKEDSIKLQKELSYRLDGLDRDLDIYQIKKDDLIIDRWHLDHDLGLPVQKRPKAVELIQ